MRLELSGEGALRGVELELPRRQALQRGRRSVQKIGGRLLGDQDLRGSDALELRAGVGDGRFHHREAARGERQPGEAQRAAVPVQREEHVVALFLEQRRVGQRAGRDDARDLALDRALGRGRIADLLADGDRLAELHQPRQVLVHRVVGHAGHLDRLRRPTRRGA